MTAGSIVTQDSTTLVDTHTEIKPYLNIRPDDSDHDEEINLINNWCSTAVEEFLGRKMVTRGTITEYHSFREDTEFLWTLESPVITVTSIHEDANRAYGATTLLVVNDDYIVTNPKGRITRVYSTGSGVRAWERGFRAVKIVYTAGYADTASVPKDVKWATMRFVSLVYREVMRKEQGLQSISDDMGNISRLFPAGLTPNIRKDLSRHKRWMFSETGEVDT